MTQPCHRLCDPLWLKLYELQVPIPHTSHHLLIFRRDNTLSKGKIWNAGIVTIPIHTRCNSNLDFSGSLEIHARFWNMYFFRAMHSSISSHSTLLPKQVVIIIQSQGLWRWTLCGHESTAVACGTTRDWKGGVTTGSWTASSIVINGPWLKIRPAPVHTCGRLQFRNIACLGQTCAVWFPSKLQAIKRFTSFCLFAQFRIQSCLGHAGVDFAWIRSLYGANAAETNARLIHWTFIVPVRRKSHMLCALSRILSIQRCF